MSVVILFLWLLALPLAVGGLFSYDGKRDIPGRWIRGQFLLWAAFQLTAVPIVLTAGTMEQILWIYVPVSLFLGVIGAALGWKKASAGATRSGQTFSGVNREEKILTVLFLGFWLFQMYMVVTQAINDGDDSFYMAVAHIADQSGSLYQANAYSIGTMELNYRYVLAPFPVWVALLSRLSGLHTLTVGHIGLGVMLITFSLAVYWQMAGELFGRLAQKLRFLLCVCVLYVWGNTSSQTAESFLITRSRQGKAFVSGVAFPALVWVLLRMGTGLDEKENARAGDYVFAGCILMAGCLGSAVGGAILLLAWGGVTCMWTVCYRRPGLLWRGILAALPGAAYSVMYLLAG